MKLLIIAGPYEADRIRRAAVSAQFETVAVEPGESLSGWISASRPDIIVMAPQMVSPDPAVALAKVRAVPRGRVPIFLVGDAADEERLRGLADGFFVRPIAPADLIEKARARVRDGEPEAAAEKSAPHAAAADAAEPATAAPTPTPAPAPTPKSGPHAARSLGSLKPLVAEGEAPAVAAPVAPEQQQQQQPAGPAAAAPSRPSPARPGDLLQQLADSLDASLDAEIHNAALGLDAEPLEAPNEALAELEDESSQKTVEVPSHVVAKLAGDVAREGASDAAGDAARKANGGSSHVHRKKTRKQKVLPPTVVGTAPTLPPEPRPAPVERGAVGLPDLVALLGRVHRERLTGRLALRRGDVEKAIFFEDGAPIIARSSQADDRMGEMLVREGLLSPEQRARAGEQAAGAGRRLGAVLVDLGLIKAGELAPLVRRHQQEILYSLFAWQDSDGGEWSLGPERPTDDEPIRIDERAPALILEGLRRKYSAARLLRCLGGGAAVLRPAAAAGALRVVDQMAPTDEERALAPLFDGVRTLDAIRALVRAPDGTLYGLAWALLAVGALEDTGPRGAGVEAAAAPAAPAAPSDADRERDRAIDRARVQARYALVCEGDYFQILGLSRDATPHEVLRAHQALARELSPSTLDAALVAELASELRAIRTVIDEGARVLVDARLRRLYQQHLPAFPAPSAPAPVAAAPRPE
jgi:CheY-like chemotaxis protein